MIESYAYKSGASFKPITVPIWILWIQCICFVILYGIWAVPETILVRHICLIVGALLSIYVIVCNKHFLLAKQALPIGMLCLLFMWALFHLIFLSSKPSLQFEEFSSIWKRTAIGFIFAVGFGLALLGRALDSKNIGSQISPFWGFIFFGFTIPTLIYLVKYFLTFEAPKFGLIAPDYLKLYFDSSKFYMPKTVYVAFCLPLFAISLGQISLQLNRPKRQPLLLFIYLIACIATVFIFYAENIKNGLMYSVILIIIFCASLCFKYRARVRFGDVFLTILILILIGYFLFHHIKKNESWATLIADIRVAIHVQHYEQWKSNGPQIYPDNELGKMVSITNYERAAWGVVGAQLLLQNPFGYGLIERSFGNLAKERWPETRLHQSHSGWLDLALGLGFPGISLILGSLAIVTFRCMQSSDIPAYFGFWLLLSLGLLWCTTEVSQKIYFDWLIFAIAWVGVLSLGFKQNQLTK